MYQNNLKAYHSFRTLLAHGIDLLYHREGFYNYSGTPSVRIRNRKINLEVPKNWISTLFYNMEYVNNPRIHDLYNITLGIKISGEKHHCILEYDAHKLCKESLKALFNDFYQAVCQCAKEY